MIDAIKYVLMVAQDEADDRKVSKTLGTLVNSIQILLLVEYF